jgi:8-oxo-dGTP pyrophosphatase MutT (NUDIX family)
MEKTVNDRRRRVVVRGQMSNIVPLGAAFHPPFDKVTSVGVVPFTDEGLIVAALLQRGVDLPGGHVQEGERTIEEVARREALEEAGITLREVQAAEVLQSDYYGPDDLTYMVLTTAFVDEYRPFVPNEASQGRITLSVEEVLAGYTAGDVEGTRHLIAAAHTVLFVGKAG